MLGIRSKGEALALLESLTAAEHDELKLHGAGDHKFWNSPTEVHKPLVVKFKEEVKAYYRSQQGRLCCYCSKELDSHKGSYDAEHVLDKKTYPEFMFFLENFAVACKSCNGSKKIKGVLVSKVRPVVVPNVSTDYLLVHPHLDEWGSHLKYDSIKRVSPKRNSSKGLHTIEICGINNLNAARLSDKFLPGKNGVAERELINFFKYKTLKRKQKVLLILRKMAVDFKLAPALALVDILEAEIVAAHPIASKKKP